YARLHADIPRPSTPRRDGTRREGMTRECGSAPDLHRRPHGPAAARRTALAQRSDVRSGRRGASRRRLRAAQDARPGAAAGRPRSAHADRGPVVGFVLTRPDAPGEAVYLSGDTVWYDGVAEVGRRFPVRTAVLFMGAARVAAVGPWHLTFTADEGVEAARAFGDATIVPVHCEDWEHFTQSRPDIDAAFRAAGLGHRLRWLPRGV